MEYLTLNNGVTMPVLGYGTYQIPPRLTEKSVSQAIEAGYRSIDTAQNYGNERGVGLAVEKSGVPRVQFFITTKTQTSGYASTVRGINRSLEELRMNYVDLLLIHWPNGDDAETWRAVEEAFLSGKARAVVLSNFNSRQFIKIAERFRTPPAVDQIETHILWQQEKMHSFLESRHCVHDSWSPFADGMGDTLHNQTILSIGAAYGKSAAQVILRFLIQCGIAVIPRSKDPRHMRENLDVFDYTLSEGEMQIIRAMDQSRSYCNWPASMQEEA
ncbi:MAG: aldo/keto reductase [Abditibacteriota bacterium]|nr:aldo/keto reductase [Abditibacteriota bacterium]